MWESGNAKARKKSKANPREIWNMKEHCQSNFLHCIHCCKYLFYSCGAISLWCFMICQRKIVESFILHVKWSDDTLPAHEMNFTYTSTKIQKTAVWNCHCSLFFGFTSKWIYDRSKCFSWDLSAAQPRNKWYFYITPRGEIQVKDLYSQRQKFHFYFHWL